VLNRTASNNGLGDANLSFVHFLLLSKFTIIRI
jgi:hypothetical protein